MNTWIKNHVAILQLRHLNTTMMKKLVFASICWIYALSGSSQVPSLKDGIKQLENENFSAALYTFNAIAKADPKNGTIYYYIGEVSYRTEDYMEAEKSYKKGQSINSQCAECKIGLGKLALDQGKTSEADELLLSASRLDKKNPQVFGLIGEAYLTAKKPNAKKAIEFLEIAKGMNPKEARYWANLGDAYKLSGDNGAAMTAYETAVSKDPSNTSAYISMARIWSGSRQYDLATARLLEAINLSPDDALPYKDLIELYIRDGAYSKVTPLLEKYVSLTGSDVDAKVRLVKFLTFQAKDYTRAIEQGESVLRTNPEQYTLHRWLAWAYAESENYQQAHDHSVKLFDALKKKEGRNSFPSDYDYWAKASFELGMIDEAAHIYRKYLELEPTRSQEIYGKIAKAYYDAKNYEQAIAYFKRKAAEKSLNNVDEYWLGYAYYLSDKNLEADSAFARILLMTPEFTTAHLMRARIGSALDTTETKLYLAMEHYENFIRYASLDKEKNKKNLIEAHNYMAWYYIQHDELGEGEEQYEMILALDSTNETALENLKILKKN